MVITNTKSFSNNKRNDCYHMSFILQDSKGVVQLNTDSLETIWAKFASLKGDSTKAPKKDCIGNQTDTST